MAPRTALLLFAALAILHTWPLAGAPARLSLNYNDDAAFFAWTLAWIAHTLPADPWNLLNGNIFAPEPATLTFADPLVAPALIGAPVRWLGGSAVLTFNLVLLAGLAATGWAGWFVVRQWTGMPGPALVAGALLAFNEHTLTRLPHTAAAHLWGLPLTLYFADRLIERPTRRHAWLLALVVAGVACTSVYTLALAGVTVVVVIARGLLAGRWRAAASAGLSAAGGLVLAAPVLIPYILLATSGVTRPLELVAQFTATPAGYLTSLSRLHQGWTEPWLRDDVNVFFAGFAALTLAAAGLIGLLRAAPTRARAAILIAVGASGVVLSFGPELRLYVWLYEWLPPLQGIRVPARFGYLFLMAVGLSAGVGLARLTAHASGRTRAAMVAAALTLVTAESLRAPIRVEPYRGVPPIYSLLADAPDPVMLVEVPFWPPDAVHLNGEYVLNSTAHWRPLMNGMSGFTPDSYRERTRSFWFFPRPDAIDTMRAEGATHLMVHLHRFEAHEREAIQRAMQARPDAELLATDPFGHRLYAMGR